MLLYGVTDRTWTQNQTLTMQVEEALKGGVTCIQLREKEIDDKEFLLLAYEIKELCNRYGVPFIINDNVSIAIECGADGIHVGQHDMKSQKVKEMIGEQMILGVSVQTVEQALDAEKNGAHYLGVGAVFSTSTKLNADDVNHSVLKEICEAVSIPVVAIGGIHKQNILELSGTKVDGVALVSAIFASRNIEEECKELLELSMKMVKG
jgi:thiamine-phosphate pyrophosphorylase